LAYSISDAVRLTGLSRATIYNMFEDGRLPSLRSASAAWSSARLDQLFVPAASCATGAAMTDSKLKFHRGRHRGPGGTAEGVAGGEARHLRRGQERRHNTKMLRRFIAERRMPDRDQIEAAMRDMRIALARAVNDVADGVEPERGASKNGVSKSTLHRAVPREDNLPMGQAADDGLEVPPFLRRFASVTEMHRYPSLPPSVRCRLRCDPTSADLIDRIANMIEGGNRRLLGVAPTGGRQDRHRGEDRRRRSAGRCAWCCSWSTAASGEAEFEQAARDGRRPRHNPPPASPRARTSLSRSQASRRCTPGR
jgi:hypothetical protein